MWGPTWNFGGGAHLPLPRHWVKLWRHVFGTSNAALPCLNFSSPNQKRYIHLISGVGGGCAEGASAPPNFLFVKSGKNTWIRAKSGKNVAQRCLTSKNGAQHLRKNKRRHFSGHTKKGLYDLCGRISGRSHRTTFRVILGSSGKNPSHRQNFACSYIYALDTNIDKLLASS